MRRVGLGLGLGLGLGFCRVELSKRGAGSRAVARRAGDKHSCYGPMVYNWRPIIGSIAIPATRVFLINQIKIYNKLREYSHSPVIHRTLFARKSLVVDYYFS
jgi:hypothetical protein